MNRRLLLIATSLWFGSMLPANADTNLLPLVNPFIGTQPGDTTPENRDVGWHAGNTFPGATLPFGMVQFSPDTGYGEQYALGGYKYGKGVVQGISLVHTSGTGCTVTQDLPILPIVGSINTSPATNLTSYQVGFQNENAEPGWYRMSMNNGINAELTVTKRTGFGRFTYPNTNEATVIFNVGRNGVGAQYAQLEIVNNDTVKGYMRTGGVCGTGGYTVYFYGQFDRTFSSFGTYAGDSVNAGSRVANQGQKNGGWVKFSSGGQIQLKLGISYVSSDNARMNLQNENPNWDFNKIKADAQSTWNASLNKIQVTGGSTADRTKFYSALYHSLLHPNLFSDVNGQYIGFDKKIYTASGWDKYANFSGWDVYRSQVQLLGWLAPKEASDMAQSMVADATAAGGGFPKWPMGNSDDCIMAGDSGTLVVANLWAFGGKNFDTAGALRIMEKSANEPGVRTGGCELRPGLTEYINRGFIPFDLLKDAPMANTLEFAVADSAIAQLAGSLGDSGKRDRYLMRAQNWKNLYSNRNGYIQQRFATGGFKSDFNPSNGDGFAEGTPGQYTWMVPQNYRGLIDAMGGNAAAVARLDHHFTVLDAGPGNERAWLGNEPEGGTPFVYNFAGAPYKTQAIVRRIMTQLYTANANGLPGNDDLGALSSWYVWAALGLYPEVPGVGGFTISTPLFTNTLVRMGNGRTLTIDAPNAGANGTYIQSMRLNGQTSTRVWVGLNQLTNDSNLSFDLGSNANTQWGSAASDAPPSFDDPRLSSAASFFADFSPSSMPDWNDTINYDANIGGICCGATHMETAARWDGVAHSGGIALMYAGIDNDTSRSFSYNKIFDVNIPVTATTQLSYWIYPEIGYDNSTYVAVDLIFTDGTSLRDSGAVDQNGVRVHPTFQGNSGRLTRGVWNQVRSTIGQSNAGKTIDRIVVGYDRPETTGSFKGYIDDIGITSGDVNGGALNGSHVLHPQHAPNLALDDAGGGLGMNNPIILWQTQNSANQTWVFANANQAGFYIISLSAGNYCLSVSGSAATLQPCNGSTAQVWKAVAQNGGYVLNPASNTGLCLDATGWGTTNGTAVGLWGCNSGANQSWAIVAP